MPKNRIAPANRGANLLLPALAAGMQHNHLPGLDGIRAITAFLVVLYHFGFSSVSGGLGVLMFFVLSGFLITWLLLKENELYGTVSLRNFYVRRSFRIFPAFYAYAGVVVSIMLVTHRAVLWPQALASLLYVNNYYQAIHGHITSPFSHTWSLGIEEQFYLLWPILFLRFRNDYRRLAAVLGGLILGFWIYRAILFAVAVPEVYLYETFDARADHLLVGCLLAVILRAGFFPKVWRAACAHTATAPLRAGMLICSNAAEVTFGHAYRDTIGAILNPLLTAIFVAQAISMAHTRMLGWLNAGWIVYLGRIAYSICLYQAIALAGPKRALAAWPMGVQLAGAVVSVIVVASVSYFLTEKPFVAVRKLFSSWTGGRPPPVAALKVA